MGTRLRVLIVGDSDDDAQSLLHELRHGGYAPEYERVGTATEMRAALGRAAWEVVLSAYSPARFNSAAALRVLREAQLNLPFIVVSDEIGAEAAVAELKAGAQDFVCKDHLERLALAVAREMAQARARQERRRAEADQRTFEAHRRQAWKMEVLGQFAGAVAHRFNNLLTTILGSVVLTQAELRGEMRAQDPAMAALVEIERAGRQAAALTRQLLTFSGHQFAKPEVIDPNAVLRDLAPSLRRLIAENVTLELLLAEDVMHIRADPRELEQVAANLVLNAREAMPNGGKLIVKTENALLGEGYVARHPEARAGWHVILTVMDTGCGMTPEAIERCFEPFFTTKGSGKAIGLGLATVHGIVRRAQGHIRVESELGHGTTFRIHFRAASHQI